MHRLGNILVLDGKRVRRTENMDLDPNSYNKEGKFFTTVDGVPVRKLFVGNLPDSSIYDCAPTEALLLGLFSAYGQLKEIRVVTNTPKPFAFVTFITPQDAAKAYNKRAGMFIHRRRLYLSFADSWHQPLDLPSGEVVWDRRTYQQVEDPAEEADHSDDQNDAQEERDGGDSVGASKEAEALEEEEEIMKDCPIDRLNDDCLHMIFDCLSTPDRLALGRVCRRWRNLNSYYWRSFKKLDFTCPPLDEIVLTDSKLRYFLHNCSNVTSLNIAQDDNDLTSDAVVIIALTCKDLEEIHMRNITIKRRSLAYLANSCPKLKSFSMDACSSIHDGEMASLVKKSKNLESIQLKYGSKTTGMWLKFIQSPLRSLILEMYEFNSEYLLEGVARARFTLKELSFMSCSKLRNQDLSKIVALVPELTRFALSGMIQLYDTTALRPITTLAQLEYLDLEHNRVVNDNFIAALVEGCPKLRQLNLSGANLMDLRFIGIETFELTERGLSRLVELTDLTHLRMACLKVTDSLLKLLSKKLNLKHLDIMGCANVTDEGCIEIINNCHELESLDLAGCKGVSNETILAAVNILSNDTNRKKLHIVAGNTKVKEEPWFHENDTGKRLNVDVKSTFISNYLEDVFQMDSEEGSEDSFDDYDVYDEYDPDQNYYGDVDLEIAFGYDHGVYDFGPDSDHDLYGEDLHEWGWHDGGW